MTISLVNGVNPLQTTLLELGIVSGRVALLLRSAEIQPLFGRFVSNTIRYSPPPPLLDICYRACGHGHACAARWLRQKAGIGMGFSTEEPEECHPYVTLRSLLVLVCLAFYCVECGAVVIYERV